MKRKGLSQILYLIIAASVLMMIAMVITFTATDIIGGAGGQATENTCTKAIQGKCATFGSDDRYVTVPGTCIREDQYTGVAASATVVDNPSSSAADCSNPGSCDETNYIYCGDVS
jgi:hypothetical protein